MNQIKREERSRSSSMSSKLSQADNEGLSMACSRLKDSIAQSTERANQFQISIAKQQRELADVLVLLRKQDRAAKLLANYAKDGVNNPLMLMQEIHGILS